MTSWRDILISSWSRDVTCRNSNQNISRGLHFQTMVLRWFWISVKGTFQRYIIWPPLTKKTIFFYLYDVFITWHRKKNIFLERGSYHIPLESSFNVDSESSKNHGLKMKSWRDILIWILACDVTWPTWNRNISPGLYFQTMVLIWFWITVTLAL